MPPIVVIAPESTSYQIVQRVATELGIQDKILLHLTGLSRSLSVARKAEQEGAYVIVARGWSANQIVEAGIRTPLVFLPISMQDLVFVLDQALAKAAKPNPRVGFIVYPQLQKELVALSSLLHVDLRIYPSGSHMGCRWMLCCIRRNISSRLRTVSLAFLNSSNNQKKLFHNVPHAWLYQQP